MVSTVVAFVVDHVSSVSVRITVNIKAESSIVSNVRAGSVVPSDSVVVSALVWSHVNSDICSEVVTDLVSNAVSSSVVLSDGLGSSVEGEPLLSVGWIVILDSDSILVTSNMLGLNNSSVSVHSGFDLESDSW